MDPRRFEVPQLQPWIRAEFSRSGGPGGQNVNKVNTQVALLFDFEACELLDDAEKRRIRTRLATRLSRAGLLRVVRSSERSQRRNREAAEEALVELLTEATRRRKPRRKTRPSAASRARRVREKRQRGEIKKLRQSRPPGDGA